MSDTQFNDVFEDETSQGEQPPGPKALREALAAEKAARKQAEQRAAELEKQYRETTVQSFIKEKGLDPRVAKFIGDEDPAKWFEENGALFGAANSTESEPEKVDDSPKGEPALPPEQLAALQQTSSVVPGTSTPGSLDAWNAQLDAATSKEDFYQRLQSGGIPSA